MRTLFLVIVASFAFGRIAAGIVIIGADERANLEAPPDGAPWNYVARLDNKFGARASGVYLGNRYVLTANHVDQDINAVNLNGANFATDDTFKPVVIEGTDMRVIRITTDPGLPPLPLIGVSESEFGKPCVMIGYGVGKGTPVANQGWNWSDDRSRKKRWATNTTAAKYYLNPDNHVSYIETAFDFSAGPTTGQLTVGDSGCALFENLGGVWKLVGIGAFVDEHGQAFYNKDLVKPGIQPDHSYFAPIHRFVIQLKKILAN